MKKNIAVLLFLLVSSVSFAQSLTFKNLSQLVHLNNVEAYLTGKAVGFAKKKDFNDRVIYIKNEGTPNEEKIEYDKRGIGYSTNNLAYVKALVKQIKYPLILKDENDKLGSNFYQYGNTQISITIDMYSKPGRPHNMSILEK